MRICSVKSPREVPVQRHRESPPVYDDFFEERLSPHTAKLAEGHVAVCAFVNDILNARTLDVLYRQNVRFVAPRCAGFNQVDVRYASSLGIKITHVPAYSPYAVAEFALGLVLALNRRIHRAYDRVRDGNFSIDGLLGFDLHEKPSVSSERERSGACSQAFLPVLGSTFWLCYQSREFTDLGGKYVDLDTLFAESDIISLHCPLTPQTFHLIDAESVAKMKKGVMIVNTNRGALVDASAVIEGLKSEQIGYLGLDVY
jgi:D-lactate dehydrogenase